ncbi:MAG: D-alanyl-D-alanine carboxypeptidase [Treponema sp.]|nr:D-alanyl-D-alanine carboxypeptidase [Treponema sp.]
MRRPLGSCGLCGSWLIILLLFFGESITAQDNRGVLSQPPQAALLPLIENAPEIVSRAAVVLDAATGTLLYAKNPYDEIPPASLTKLMTMHLVQNEINAGRADLDETVSITPESWAINQPRGSSLMFLGPGQTCTLRDIMLGLAVCSGNDAAIAAALACAPTVDDFVSMMNSEALRLGFTVTRFTEPSGISEHNITCAAEFAYLCRYYLAMHPQALEMFHSVREFSWPRPENVAPNFRDDPHTITQYNRNNLLRTYPGVDGMKTGYIDESGYNIALTAERNGTRFIAVILGAPTGRSGERIRDDDGRRLLDWAFANFKTVYPEIGKLKETRLWKGKEKTVHFKLAQPDPLAAGAAFTSGNTAFIAPAGSAAFTAPANRAQSLWVSYEFTDPLIAPLPADYPAGSLIISDEQSELYRVQLLTDKVYERGNIFRRIWDSLRLLFYRPAAFQKTI